LNSIAASSDGTSLLASGAGPSNVEGIFNSNDTGSTWTTTAAPQMNYLGFGLSNDGSVIAAKLDDGSTDMLYSIDSGTTWSTYATMPGVNWSGPIYCNSTGSRWIASNLGDAVANVLVSVGTFDGTTWLWYQTPFGPNATGNDAVVAPYDYPLDFMVSKGGGKLFVAFTNHLYLSNATLLSDFSNAGGLAAWTEINNPGTGMVRATMSGVGHHIFVVWNNTVWRSLDNGVTWTQANSLPLSTGENVGQIVTTFDGLIVAVYALNGATGHVYVSIDGGLNFVQTSAGVLAWDLIGIEPH
jgi:hypothetical protein